MTKIPKSLEPIKLKPEWPKPKVVVVGAGMAGLSAAAELVNGGITNVIVLEAKQR